MLYTCQILTGLARSVNIWNGFLDQTTYSQLQSGALWVPEPIDMPGFGKCLHRPREFQQPRHGGTSCAKEMYLLVGKPYQMLPYFQKTKDVELSKLTSGKSGIILIIHKKENHDM